MSQVPDLGQLLQTAHEEGDLSARSLAVLNVHDVGQAIQSGLGISALDVGSTELVLVAVLVDDSGSIRFAGNADAVCEGTNGLIDALMGSKQRQSILMHTRYLSSGFVLNPWCLLEDAKRLGAHNYNPMGGTPLYDQSVMLLGSVFAKAQEAKANGQIARTVTVIVTDGHDEHSVRTARDVEPIVRDMLMAEVHIIAGVGISDGATDFHGVFGEMGIHQEWILTPSNTRSDIRRAFQLVSSSAVRASQGAVSFSQTAAGGFGAP